MEAYSLYEGSYSVDSSKKFIPFDPEKEDKKDRKGSLFIHVHPFLLRTRNDLILIDTGLGYKDEKGEYVLYNNIRKFGFEPQDVSLVLLSHLHQDHASGIVNEQDKRLQIAFSEANYIVPKGEWEKNYNKEASSLNTELLEVLHRSGKLELVDGSGNINGEISHEHSGGHTEFHQVFHVIEGKEHYFYGGDELPEPEQLHRKFAAKYDFDGRKAMKLREEYGERAVNEGWTCLFYHSTGAPFGKVEKKDESFRVIESPK